MFLSTSLLGLISVNPDICISAMLTCYKEHVRCLLLSWTLIRRNAAVRIDLVLKAVSRDSNNETLWFCLVSRRTVKVVKLILWIKVRHLLMILNVLCCVHPLDFDYPMLFFWATVVGFLCAFAYFFPGSFLLFWQISFWLMAGFVSSVVSGRVFASHMCH